MAKKDTSIDLSEQPLIIQLIALIFFIIIIFLVFESFYPDLYNKLILIFWIVIPLLIILLTYYIVKKIKKGEKIDWINFLKNLITVPEVSKKVREEQREPRLSQKELTKLKYERGSVCEHPNCNEEIGLDVHHIIAWHTGVKGVNKRSNLIILCKKHHNQADKGIYSKTDLKYWISKKKKK